MGGLEERLDAAERMIKAESFRQNKGLGNEVGYYVFDYPAEKELIVRERIEYMKSKNSKGTDGFELVVYDLYDIIIDLLEKEGFMEQCFKLEKKKGIEKVTEALGRLLKIDESDNYLVEYIESNTPQNAVILLIGIGKCFPILRSHKVLNVLHQKIDQIPVVLFFPGEYTGQEFILFSKLNDNYYRAFKLVD